MLSDLSPCLFPVFINYLFLDVGGPGHASENLGTGVLLPQHSNQPVSQHTLSTATLLHGLKPFETEFLNDLNIFSEFSLFKRLKP